MLELTNAQRGCFGLIPVESSWVRIQPRPSPHHNYTTIAYLDGRIIRKLIMTGNSLYSESEVCEELSEDLSFLLPKTPKGKPVPLSAAALEKRGRFGMCLSWLQRREYSYLDLYSNTSQKCYYTNSYEAFRGELDFPAWVDSWCSESTPEDLAEVAVFAAEPRKHVKFREGDVFRFKINRRLYGYGRILLDYAAMRRRKEPFWDILMGKPLACSVYHIVTERTDVGIEELKGLPSLPSVHMMDNRLYYGDFEIIGNIPIGEAEDYPILYGGSIDARYRSVLLQCGRLYRREDGGKALFRDFTNNHIGFDLSFALPVLLECIKKKSNAPYWNQDSWKVNRDLRNPKFRRELEQVCRQFGLSPSQLIR